MYYSLEEQNKDFQLFIIAFDEISYNVLSKLHLSYAVIISLTEFEDEHLIKIKPSRTKGEYCWTCTPSIIIYCITKFNLEHCTYVDADLYFYNDPQILIDEVEGKSILITEHRYSLVDCTWAVLNGKYCVQFLYFKNDVFGIRALQWWRDACLEWCFNKRENGKFGDQKYLDDWIYRFNNVHELKHLGGGVAPWNIQQYDVIIEGKNIIGRLKLLPHYTFDLIFYHFHAIEFYIDKKINLSTFELSQEIIDSLYKPYIKKLLDLKRKVQLIDISFDPNGSSKRSDIPHFTFILYLTYFFYGFKETMKQCIKAIINLLIFKDLKFRLKKNNIKRMNELAK